MGLDYSDFGLLRIGMGFLFSLATLLGPPCFFFRCVVCDTFFVVVVSPRSCLATCRYVIKRNGKKEHVQFDKITSRIKKLA